MLFTYRFRSRLSRGFGGVEFVSRKRVSSVLKVRVGKLEAVSRFGFSS